MKRVWSVEELDEQWSVGPRDRELPYRKESSGRLGLVAQLAFYRRHARFPEHRNAFAPMVLEHLAEQIDVLTSTLDGYEWDGRTGRRHRETILEFLGVGAFDLVAEADFRAWLMTEALPREPSADALDEAITCWLLRSKIDRLGNYRFERIVRSSRYAHDERVLLDVHARLDTATRERLDKAAKTLFLCDYLDSEPLRREIHEGLNVIENWNSANGFIWFGKGGEIATHRMEDQEVSVLALHLLQSCLVYINTLMLQRVLEEPSWHKRMTDVDLRGLTPVVYAHVSPYGSFELKMHERIDIDMRMAS